MKDISSERNSQGFSILRHQVQKLGREAYEKYGCNFVAILMDEPEPNCEGRLSKPSMIYETPGASGSFDGHIRSDYMNLLTERLVAHVRGHSEVEHGASRGRVLRRAEGNLSGVPDQDFARGDSCDSNQCSDPDQDFGSDFSGPSQSPRDRPLTGGGFRLRPYFLNAKKAIANEANQAGVDIHWRILPWKRLPDICASSGVYINNYPDGLVSPFDSRTMRDIGIAGLSDDEHKILIHGLRHEKMSPMRFLPMENAHDIMNNEFPVLIYAPPPPDSPRARSKRVFLDGTFDYKGHHRVEVVRDLDNERQKKRRGRPRKIPYKNVQELEVLDFVQHSVSKRRLNESFVDRPEKRNRFIGT